jgi:hypothetical protein
MSTTEPKLRLTLAPTRPTSAARLAALTCLLHLASALAAAALSLSVDRTTAMAGESTVYHVEGAPPNSPIYWSSWRNGASTGEVDVYYGHNTDAQGGWTALASPWLPGHVGIWVKQARVGGLLASVSFTVTPRLALDKGVYAAGDAPRYTLTGAAPNSPIYWSSWLNGASTGETNAYYQQNTDANGNWSAFGGQWSAGNAGTWVKQAGVGGSSVAVTFEVRAAPLTRVQQKVGIYDWRPGQAADGVRRIAGLGGRVARVVIEPNCGQARPQTLLELASSADSLQAFGNPDIGTFVLTAYDRASLCNDGTHIYTDPALYSNPASRNAAVAEYQDLALYLLRTFHNSGKRFFIAHWEGDNAIYCQSAYDYLVNSIKVCPWNPSQTIPYRQCCDGSYPAAYHGLTGIQDSIDGFKGWLAARQSGVNAARNQAAAEGIQGVTVLNAAEINSVNMLRGGGLKSMLYDVLPYVATDAVSYSSYESTGGPPFSGAGRLTTDLGTIAGQAGTSQVIIGEMGYDRPQALAQGYTDQDIANHNDAMLNAALDWGVAATCHWVLIDDHFGLFDSGFNLQPIGQYYQGKFQAP